MKNEIVLFQSGEHAEHIEVRLDEEKETFWMTLKQISNLFERDKSVISKHFKYIFKENELDKNSVDAFFATTAIIRKPITRQSSFGVLCHEWISGTK